MIYSTLVTPLANHFHITYMTKTVDYKSIQLTNSHISGKHCMTLFIINYNNNSLRAVSETIITELTSFSTFNVRGPTKNLVFTVV